MAQVELEGLLARARYWGIRIATAESCTGGMVAAALTEVAGSSDMFDRGFVTYSNAAKVAVLGVPQALIDAHGAVSEPVAIEMAEGALKRSDAVLAVAITGIAGPGGSEWKPEGRVCFALPPQWRDDRGRNGGVRRAWPEEGAQGGNGARAGAVGEGVGVGKPAPPRS